MTHVVACTAGSAAVRFTFIEPWLRLTLTIDAHRHTFNSRVAALNEQEGGSAE